MNNDNDLEIDWTKVCESQEKAKDNLFNANHRNAMIQAYGHTQAKIINIEDLI